MKQIRCDYCHEYVEWSAYSKHLEQHQKVRQDRQQTDYVTLAPEDREAGDLAGVPRIYVHERCGQETEMPEEIVRSYLKNPYLYLSNKTFCTGCSKHVPFGECEWTETGEDLQSYTDRLRSEKLEMRPNVLLRMLAAILRPFT
jgi:hypothetical protein